MVKRFLLTAIAIVLINSIGVCQQSSSISSSILDLIENKDVLFNKFGVTPLHLTDSSKILIDFLTHDQWVGSPDPNSGLFLKGETGLLPNDYSLGLIVSFRKYGIFEHRAIIAGVKKGISFGSNLNFDFGLNIGFKQLGMEENNIFIPGPTIDNETVWLGTPTVDLGVAYKYKNQRIGLSYKNMGTSKIRFQFTEYEIKENGLVANYQGVYSLSKNISFIPEIYGCFTSAKNYAIIVGQISYKNYLTFGALYNSNNIYGFLISGTIFKRVKIGYFSDFSVDKTNNNPVGSSGLNLGLILK